jgi:hypothetical protein
MSSDEEASKKKRKKEKKDDKKFLEMFETKDETKDETKSESEEDRPSIIPKQFHRTPVNPLIDYKYINNDDKELWLIQAPQDVRFT